MIFWFAALASNPHPSRAWRIPRVGHCVHLRSDCIVHLHSFLERNVYLRSFFEFLATYETQMNAIERCVHFKWTQMNAEHVAFTSSERKWTQWTLRSLQVNANERCERCVHFKWTQMNVFTLFYGFFAFFVHFWGLFWTQKGLFWTQKEPLWIMANFDPPKWMQNERCVHFKWMQMNAVNIAFTSSERKWTQWTLFTWNERKWTHESCVHLKRTFTQPWNTQRCLRYYIQPRVSHYKRNQVHIHLVQ